VRVLRPHSFLIRQGLIASIAFLTPVFLVLYFQSIPNGPWPAVLATQVIATLAVTIASWRYYASAIWVSPDEITERGFFTTKRTFARTEVASAYLCYTFTGPYTAPIPQLFVRDAEGKQLVRMRGQFWSRETMDTVVETLRVPLTIQPEPVSIAELRRASPQLLYWFERHPVWALIALLLMAAALGGVLLLVLQLLGTG